MRWTAENALENMHGRPSDLTPGEQAERVRACASCPQRVAGECLPARQLISVHALRKANLCPHGKWPGDGERETGGRRDKASTRVALSPRPLVSHSYPNAEHRPIRKMAAVTCYYNPCGYRRIRENYHRFKAALPSELPLYTVELAFGDQSFELFGDRMIHRRGHAKNLLWQKERLLNLAIDHVHWRYDAVCWLDADLLWLNPAWLEAAYEKLETANVVQLFERVADTDKDGRVLETRPGYVRARLDGLSYGRPGGGWAARREALPAEMYDRHIIGGGDSAMVHAWEEANTLPPSLAFGPAWLDDFEAWAARASIGRAMACIPGDVVHLYHGSRENRAYVERYDILHEYDYDPREDVAIDPKSGLLEWTEHARREKPGMLRRVADYFQQRREDD